MKSYLLGIDIGTSACKVAVFDRNGKVLAAASGDYPVYYPHEGWAESGVKGFIDIFQFKHFYLPPLLTGLLKYLPFQYGNARKRATTIAESIFRRSVSMPIQITA